MSVLRSIEHRIESIVEGVFGRAFRTHVQPVELARKLAKEMDEAKSVSVSRVYVPNEYTLYLCPSDRDQFSSYEDSLRTELSDYLSEHARREGYALLSTPAVLIEEDEDLSVGEFGIATRMVQPERPQAPAPPDVVPQARPSETRIYRPTVTGGGDARGGGGQRPGADAGRRHRGRQPPRAGRPGAGHRPLTRLRHHRRRSQRLAAPRGDPPRGRRVLDRRPRLDERRHGGRQAGRARPARARPRDPPRHAPRSASNAGTSGDA